MPVPPKLFSRQELLFFREQARRAGKTVVHCHGCFDIVHPGHIQYLQFAASLGDVLLVTVSADPQVNKGFNRPLIPDDLRAASLAALECVHGVYVNPNPTAVEILSELKPDIYVKGREYENNHDPRFLAERDEVVRHGGRVVFSSGDCVYSSTALIGALESSEPFNNEKVRRFRSDFDLGPAALAQLLDDCRGKRMLVIGDYIQDRYHFCDATGVASEGPMMSLRSQSVQTYDGGAAIIARHLAGIGAQATLVTSLADDDASEQLQHRLTAEGIAVRAIHRRQQLIRKTRYLVEGQKMFKVDEGSAKPIDSGDVRTIAEMIDPSAFDGVIFADFGYGMITTALLNRILPDLRKRVPVITADVSGKQNLLTRLIDMDLLCPTEQEARQSLNDFSSGLNAVVYQLMAQTRAQAAMITMGKQGLCLFDQRKDTGPQDSWERKLRAAYLPALGDRAVDSLGCGDALLATASLVLTAGGTHQAAAFLGSVSASVEAQHIGNIPVTRDDLLARLHINAPLQSMRLAA